MLVTTFRRLTDLRCPACGAVQPVFPLQTTFKGGLTRFALNSDVGCSSCFARLRLVPRYGDGETALFQLALMVFATALFLFGFVPLIGFVLTAFGGWGLLVLLLIVGLEPMLRAAVMGRLGPLYREVVRL